MQRGSARRHAACHVARQAASLAARPACSKHERERQSQQAASARCLNRPGTHLAAASSACARSCLMARRRASMACSRGGGGARMDAQPCRAEAKNTGRLRTCAAVATGRQAGSECACAAPFLPHRCAPAPLPPPWLPGRAAGRPGPSCPAGAAAAPAGSSTQQGGRGHVRTRQHTARSTKPVGEGEAHARPAAQAQSQAAPHMLACRRPAEQGPSARDPPAPGTPGKRMCAPRPRPRSPPRGPGPGPQRTCRCRCCRRLSAGQAAGPAGRDMRGGG